MLALALTGACYGGAPPKYKGIPLPELEPGAEITVRTRTTTTMENVRKKSYSCPAGHAQGSPQCVVTYYDEREPVTRTSSTAYYGAKPISYGQFKMMTNANLDRDVAHLESLSRACRRADIPRWAGIGLLAGGVILPAVVKNDTGRTLSGVSFLGGLGSYSLGYLFFGGRDCVRARRLHQELDVSRLGDMRTVSGSARAHEMQVLADRFNQMHRARSAGELSPPSATSPIQNVAP